MKRYDTAFVPPHPRGWLARLFDSLFGRPKAERVRRESTQPMPNVEFWNDTSPAVWRFRERANEARMLLRRYAENKSASRRAWVADGHTQPSWNRARRLLIAAKVIDREGQLLYTPRDAQNRLDAYLGRLEAKVRAKARFIAP